MNPVLTILNTPVATLPEAIFKSVYLPKLLNVNNPIFFTTSWIDEVSKNPYGWVDITDSNGDVIFKVPPLSESLVDKTNSEIGANLNYASKQIENLPLRGVEYLKQLLPTLVTFKSPAVGMYTKHWREILVRYGYDEILESITANESKLAETDTSEYVDDGWD